MNYSMDVRPRVKPIYPRYREDAEHFRVGAQRELTKQISDPQGQAWFLCDLLDGTRTFVEIVDAMRAQFPELSHDDVVAGVAYLDETGLLDRASDTEFDRPGPRRRYYGNLNFFSHFERLADERGARQRKLCDSTVTLLGLGGGGSTVLQLLTALGFGKVRAVDYDRVEVENLNRQLLFREADLGRSKTQAALDMARSRNSLQEFEFHDRYLDSVSTISELISGSDIVISVVDEPQRLILRQVNRACVRAGIPCVFGGSQVSRGRVFSVIPGASGCIDCMFLHYREMDPAWLHRFREFGLTENKIPTVAFAPSVMRLAAEIADEATRIITGYTTPRSVAAQLEIDFESGSADPFLSWARQPEACPTCGTGDEAEFARALGFAPLDEAAVPA